MGNNAPIGVFDSGIGGITVVKELRKAMPNENIIYFGDTARAPYGSRPPAEILRFMHEILRFFLAQQVKMAVVACNTMTALGLDVARKQYPILLVGVNTGARSALKVSRNKNIGIIATQATIASGKHGKAIKIFDPNAASYPQACPKFVRLIEHEHLDDEKITEAALEYLLPLKEAEVDTLILGCTHYPCISPVIQRIMGDDVVLINPARDTAVDARTMLTKSGKIADPGQGTVRLCFSADIERAGRLAEIILGESVSPPEMVNLQEFS